MNKYHNYKKNQIEFCGTEIFDSQKLLSQIDSMNFEEFAKNRHSVRDFAVDTVDESIIRKAVELAQTAPSACNRQSTRVHYIQNRDICKNVLDLQGGAKGHTVSSVIVLTSELSLYNHIIMDYSIHDAIEAGFNHVVFIIRKDIEKEFKEVIGDRIASICSSHNVTVDYAFQDINDIPGTLPEGRTKPWGTGQAVLAAKNVIDTPFIVINADDYYGKEGFKAVHEYLVNGGKSCMAGFVLKNTLSDNGGVTRGICKMDEQNNLTEVVETKNIVKTADGAEADGVAVDVNSLVSMNMWGLTPDFLDVLEEGFKEFFEKEVPSNPQKAEYLIPIFIGELLEQGKMSVKVLKTNDTWYGMTYHEDVAAVKGSFKEMLENGVYKADLFSDL